MTRQQRRHHERQQAKRNASAILVKPLETAVKWAFSPHSWRATPVAPAPPPAIAIDCNQETIRQSDPLHDTPDAGASAAANAGGGPYTKRCKDCQQQQPLDMFGVDRRSTDGLNIYCKPCARNKFIAAQAKRDARAKRNPKYLAPGTYEKTKYCPDCHEQKPASEYGLTANGNLNKRCKPCQNRRDLECTYGKTPREKDAVRGPKIRAKEKICEGCRKSHEYRFYKADASGLFGISDYCVLCSTIMAVIKGEIDLDPYPSLRGAMLGAGGVENYQDEEHDDDECEEKPRRRNHL